MSSRLHLAILGAAGQVGFGVLSRLRQDPDIAAIGICRNALSAAPLAAAGIETRIGSPHSASEWEALLAGCDGILNAAYALGNSRKVRAANQALLAGLERVPVSCFMHLSTVALFGSNLKPGASFDRPPLPHAYAREKWQLERQLARWPRRAGRRVLTLRMGHVYGPGQWVSRYIFDQVQNPAFSLPHDGQGVSNAIHVDNVAEAVREILLQSKLQTSTYNLTDNPQSNWRQLFDLHAEAAGLPPVQAMSPAEAEAALRRLLAGQTSRQRVRREIRAWVLSLPMALVQASPAVKDLVIASSRVLLSEPRHRRAMSGYMRASARPRPTAMAADEVLFSLPVPGPLLPYRGLPLARAVPELGAWYRILTDPWSLAEAADEASTPAHA